MGTSGVPISRKSAPTRMGRSRSSAPQAAQRAAIEVDRSKGDFKYAEDYAFDAGVGLTPATIDYIAQGNDKYVAFTEGKNYEDTGMLLRDFVLEAINRRDYPVIQCFTLVMTVVFVGLFWALLWLGAGLFKLLDVRFFEELLGKRWFYLPALTLAVQPLVFARLAGFLASHLALNEDPLRKLMEAMMHGYTEAEKLAPDHGHYHDDETGYGHSH